MWQIVDAAARKIAKEEERVKFFGSSSTMLEAVFG